MLMVNWREDIEFIYVLIILVSGIVTFFSLYEWTGMIFAGAADAVLIVCEAAAGFIAFETDWAIARWDKLGKNQPK
jgi:hypothetical protein